jgi:hypothetical protein
MTGAHTLEMAYQCLWCWIYGDDPDMCAWCGCEMLQVVTDEDVVMNRYVKGKLRFSVVSLILPKNNYNEW